MRTTTLLTLGITLVLRVILASCALGAENYLQNGDFEGLVNRNMPDKWGAWNENTYTASVIKGFNGNSVCIKMDKLETFYLIQGVDAGKLRGRTVVLSAMVKVDGVGEFKYFYSAGVLGLLADGGSVEGAATFRDNFDWRRVTTDPRKVPDNVKGITVIIGTHTAKGTFCFDDVTLRTVTPKEAEKIKAEKNAEDKEGFTITEDLGNGVVKGIQDGKEILVVNGNQWRKIEREKDPTLPVIPSDYEDKGYIPFARAAEIYSDSIPRETEIVKDLSIFATPGEYEPVSLAVHALRDLAGVKLSVSDFISSAGNEIGREAADIRVVKSIPVKADFAQSRKYRIVPRILEKETSVSIPQNTTARFWITVKLPASAKPGRYRSTILIAPEKAAPTRLPLTLRVLPFTLRDDGYRGILWYSDERARWDNLQARRADGKRVYEMTFRDIREHGLNSLLFGIGVVKMRRNGEEPEIDFSYVDELMDAYKKVGFTAPVALAPCGENQDFLTGLVAKAWNVDLEKVQINEETDYPVALREPFKRAMRAIAKHAEEKDWPEIYPYLADEPCSGSRQVLARALAEYTLAKEAVPEMKTFCTAYGWEPAEKFGDTLDIRCDDLHNLMSGDKYNKAAMASAAKTGKAVWAVSWPAMYDDFLSVRREAGFFQEKAGVSGSVWWTCYSPAASDDVYFDLRGYGFKACSFTYTKTLNKIEAPTPSLSWEGMREGIDDSRYVKTLKYYIARAGESGNQKAKQEAAEAERVLSGVLESIPWESAPKQEKERFNNARANALRWTVAESTVKLVEALK